MTTRPLRLLVSALLAGALLVPTVVDARSFRAAQVPGGSCDTCHIVPGGPRNLLGQQIEALLPEPKASQSVDWPLVYGLDADGAGESIRAD